MSKELAKDQLQQEVSSGYLEFYELEIGTGSNNVLYFHDGKNENAADITYDGNTYISLPILMTGIEVTSSGAMSRPTLTIANVESMLKSQSKFKTQMEDGTWDATVDGNTMTATDFSLDKLVGSRLIRRRTLEKYLTSSPVVEFGKDTYIIDRIQSKNNLWVVLELAAPFDLAGIRIPSRVVIGKYCPWQYTAASTENANPGGACIWKTHSQYSYTDSGATKVGHVFVTVDDEPLMKKSSMGSTAWSSSSTYGLDDFVVSNYIYYRSRIPNNTNNAVTSGVHWTLCRDYTIWSDHDMDEDTFSINADDPRKNDYVFHSNTVWRCIKAHVASTDFTPKLGSKHWVRADVCGKLLKSCKLRYQAQRKTSNTGVATNLLVSDVVNTDSELPFGGFPGSRKFR